MFTRWDQAIGTCLVGHDDAGCVYNGATPGGGHWRPADNCTQSHGELCDFDPTHTAATRFTGWGTGTLVWQVTACWPCATRWVALNPCWT